MKITKSHLIELIKESIKEQYEAPSSSEGQDLLNNKDVFAVVRDETTVVGIYTTREEARQYFSRGEDMIYRCKLSVVSEGTFGE